MLNIKIKKLNKNVELPKQSTQGAAGMDFYLPQPVRFEPHYSKKVPLGVAVEIPEGYVILLIPRSSTWKTPLRMPNSVGVIDSDYRGEVVCITTEYTPPYMDGRGRRAISARCNYACAQRSNTRG